MTSRGPTGLCRRRHALRRLLFFTAFLPFASAGHSPLSAQEQPGLRILERQVRLTLDESGEYRVVEAMRVRLEAIPADSAQALAPLPLLLLQEDAVGARGVGGDVPPRQVIRDENRLAIVGPVPGPSFEIAVTYRLRPGAGVLALGSAAAVDELAVFVDRGRIEVRPDPVFAREADVGPAAQPSLQLVARDLSAGSTLQLGLISRRTGWRERFVVSFVTLLAAIFAGIWAWRRAN